MRLMSHCASLAAAAGTVLPMAFIGTAQAEFAATVIVTRRDLNTGARSTVPGLPAATTALAAANGVSVLWNEPTTANPGLSPNNGLPVIDASGNVHWVGTMAQTSYTDPNTLATVFLTGTTSNFSATGQSNNRAIFRSSAASGYTFSGVEMVARDGSSSSPASASAGNMPLLGGPTPGGIGTNVLNGTNNGPGLAAGITVSPNGNMLFNSLVAPVGGTNVGAAFFTGPSGGASQAGMHGVALDGTAGATLNLTGSQVVNSVSVNNSGQFVFTATPTGGDTHTGADPAGQNNSGMWRFSQSGNTKIFRRSDPAPGVTDATGAGQNYVFGAGVANNARINASGAAVFSNNLATANLPTGVATPATAVDGVLYTTVGGSLNRIAQSGTTVGAALPGVSYANATSTSSTSAFLAVPNQAINNAGTVLYDAKFLAGTGGITLNTNDQALMAWRSGGSQVLFQSGVSQVPGASAGTTFASLFPSVGIVNRVLNNAEHVSFVGTMNAGGTTDLGPITSSNNLGLFFSDITGSLPSQLIAQGGMTAPGTGSTFGNAGFNGVIMNNNDLMVFSNVLADARTGYFAWSPDMGLVNLFNSGTTSLLGPNYPLGSISYSGVSNGNGGVLSLNDNGLFTFFANAPANGAFPVNNVLMVMQIPAPGAAGALALLGLVAARRRRA